MAGIALAYFYSERGGAKNTRYLSLSRSVVAFGWALFAIVMGLCIYGSYGMQSPSPLVAGECTWNRYQFFFAITFLPVGWAFCIMWVVFCGIFGYGTVFMSMECL